MTTRVEARAKRTHARRSCELCKVRKTRCELPDLDIPSSSEPLPPEKACHRCQVLSLPCVVDDFKRQLGKAVAAQVTQSGPASSKGTPPEKKRRKKVARGSLAQTEDGRTTLAAQLELRGGAETELDIFHAFRPWSQDGLPNGSDDAAGREGLMPPFGSTEPSISPQSMSLRLHSRPLENACAMLRVAYGKQKDLKRTSWTWEEIHLGSLVNEEMRAKLSVGIDYLRTFHPWLDSLPTLFDRYNADPSPSSDLLLSTVLHLASSSLPFATEAEALRRRLTPRILGLRDEIVVSLPRSLAALQALVLLSIHAPFGHLAFQSVDLGTLTVARGQGACALSLATAMQIPGMVKHLMSADVNSGTAFNDPHLWLWSDLSVSQAALAFEDEISEKPTCLSSVQEIADTFLSLDRIQLWRQAIEHNPVSIVVGRLAICDRIARLSAVHDSFGRLRQSLLASATEFGFDMVEATDVELNHLKRVLTEIDYKHDSILQELTPFTLGIERGWLTFRNLRRRFDANKANLLGLRSLIATAYIPDGPLAFAGLPSGMPPAQKVSYAMSRAHNPPDMMAFIVAISNPATQLTWVWGEHRGDLLRDIVSNTLIWAEFMSSQPDSQHVPTIPLHETICIALETVKILMEMQAASIITLKRSGRELRTKYVVPNWLHELSPIRDSLRRLEGQHDKSLNDVQNDRFEPLSRGCANLISSMMRVADDWARTTEREDVETRSTEFVTDPNDARHVPYTPLTGQNFDPTTAADPSAPVIGQNDPTYVGFQSQGQGYMHSSDRWMATDHNGQNPIQLDPSLGTQPTHQVGHPGHWSQEHSEATALDRLLGQIFNYAGSSHN